MDVETYDSEHETYTSSGSCFAYRTNLRASAHAQSTATSRRPGAENTSRSSVSVDSVVEDVAMGS